MDIDISSYNSQIFTCFEEYFKYYNDKCGFIKITYRDLKVTSLDLIGWDYLWEIYLCSPDHKVMQKAQKFLLRLSNRLENKSNRINFIDTALQYIRNSYTKIKTQDNTNPENKSETERTIRSLNFISDFLQEYGELRVQKGGHKADDAIQVIISNQLPQAEGQKRFNLTLYKTMTANEAKALIASKLTPPVAPKDVTLITKGYFIPDEDIVIEELPVKIKNEQTIMCTKNSNADDTEMPAIPLIGPQLPGPIAIANTVDENSQDVWQKLENLQMFIPGLDLDFARWMLKRKNYDVDETASSLLDPDLADYLQNQYLSEAKEEETGANYASPAKPGSPGDDSKPKEESMSQKISDSTENMELFFNLLGLDITEIESKVWSLLRNLPINRGIYDQIVNVFGSPSEGYYYESTDLDWEYILNPQTTPKLLYSLQIVDSLVNFDTQSSLDIDSDVKTRWRECFLQTGGFTYLMNYLLDYNEANLVRKSNNNSSYLHNTEANALYLMLNVLGQYLHTALFAISLKTQQKFLAKTMKVFAAEDLDKKIIDDLIDGKSKDTGAMDTESPVKSGGNSSFYSPDKENKIKSPTSNKDTKVSANAAANNVEEFAKLLSTMKENQCLLADQALQLFNLRDIAIRLLNIVKTALYGMEYDRDLTLVAESVFDFLLPCFVVFPTLLPILYEYEGTELILKTVFFESQQECVRNKLINLISFLSLNFSQVSYNESRLSRKLSKEGFISPKKERMNNEDFAEEMDENAHINSEHRLDSPEAIKKELSTIKVDSLSPHIFFLKTLLPFIYSSDASKQINLEYFQMLSNLIRISEPAALREITNLSRLYAYSIQFIINRPIIEDRASQIEDKPLSGFLLLSQTLVEIEPSLKTLFEPNSTSPLLDQFNLKNIDLMKALYDFLFCLPNGNELSSSSLGFPKFKHKRTRLHAFNFMRVLCNNDQYNLQTLLHHLTVNHQSLPNFTVEGSVSTAPMVNSELKNATGYVGLKNLGCTCYMNSLLQQFYMILPLRNALLNSDVVVKLKELKANTGSEGDNLDEQYEEKDTLLSTIAGQVLETNKKDIDTQLSDNLLYQLQHLLAHLTQSESEYIYPNQFFNSIKTINGEKIVLNIQQDVNEFFNTLCEKLENCMKGTPQSTILPDLIGGVLSHEIISLEKDYPYYTEREEAYLTIPLDIKNKRDINDALNLFIKEDILEGDNKYFCEKYDRKIKVMKRCCIKTLPNTLIVTLKRFDFDFTTMLKVKINDYFEFPLTLNIKPWTKVGLKDQIPPEAGYEPEDHPESYYNYELVGVLVHSGTADGGHYYSFIKDRSGASKGWFEFNDNKVKTFDLKNIKHECFGSENSSAKEFHDEFDMVSTRSAYILFYERAEPTELAKSYESKGVPETISRVIENENLELLKNIYFYNSDYFNFMYDILTFFNLLAVEEISKINSELGYFNQLETLLQGDLEGNTANNAVRRRGENIQNTIGDKIYAINDDEKKNVAVIRLALILSVEMYLKNKDAENFAKWTELVQGMIAKYVPGAIWLINFITRNVDFVYR